MKLITTEVVETGEKRDKRGRRIVPQKERSALIAAYEASGLTQRDFAQKEGIKFCTFTTWLSRHRKEKVQAKFAEVSLERMKDPGSLEIVLPNGLVVRGKNVEQLVAFLERLRPC